MQNNIDYKVLLGDALTTIKKINGENYLYIKSALIIKAITVLSTDNTLLFKSLMDMFAVDYVKQKKKFFIYYKLHSMHNHQSVFLVCEISQNEIMTSTCSVFANANWYEREIYDMFGIIFRGHPDLRNIFTSPTISEHLLKKC